MKKTKHITINLDEIQYKQLLNASTKENRTLTNYCYLLLIKAAKDVKQ